MTAKYYVYTTESETALEFNSYREIAEAFDLSISTVYGIAKNKRVKKRATITEIKSGVALESGVRARAPHLLRAPLLKAHRLQVNMLNRHSYEVLKSFTSVAEACEYLGAGASCASGIYKCARGERRVANGYAWEIIPIDTLDIPDTYMTAGEVRYVLTYKDKELRFSTLKEIAESLNVGKAVVRETLKGEVTSLSKRGVMIFHIVEYDELVPLREHKFGHRKTRGAVKINMLDRYTHEILDTFDSLQEASDDLRASSSDYIRWACVSGNVAYGYKWEYAQ